MRTYILLLSLMIAISCSKENQQENQKELEINITKTEWYTSISDRGFGEVYLNIEGNTNAELVTIDTYGDGLAGCYEVKLDKNKNFSEKIMILFHPNPDTLPRKYQTHVNAYEKSESPDVIDCRTGTGNKIRKLIESGYVTFKQRD